MEGFICCCLVGSCLVISLVSAYGVFWLFKDTPDEEYEATVVNANKGLPDSVYVWQDRIDSLNKEIDRLEAIQDSTYFWVYKIELLEKNIEFFTEFRNLIDGIME